MPKQMASHVGLVQKMRLQQAIKKAYIKGDMKAAQSLQQQLQGLNKKTAPKK
jgi:hypothetical protein